MKAGVLSEEKRQHGHVRFIGKRACPEHVEYPRVVLATWRPMALWVMLRRGRELKVAFPVARSGDLDTVRGPLAPRRNMVSFAVDDVNIS